MPRLLILSQPSRMNGQIWLLAFNAAVSGLSYGYALTSIGPALLQAKRRNGGMSDPCPGITDHPLSLTEQEKLTSFITLGAFVGCCLASWVNWYWGRRKTIIFAAVVLSIGSVMMGMAASLLPMLIARLITGLAFGITTHTVPLYVSECTPPHLRGSVSFFYIIMIAGGMLTAAIVGCLLFWLDVRNGWRWMLAASVLPALLMVVGFAMQPESPRWLLSKGREEEAKEAFAILQGEDDETRKLLEDGVEAPSRPNLEARSTEFDDMVQAINAEQPCSSIGCGMSEVFSYWSNTYIRRALMLGCFLMFMNQCCGMNLIIFYGPSLLQRAVGTGLATDTETCFTHDNKVNVALNISFPFLLMLGNVFAWCLVEKAGRRPLMLCSTALVAMSLGAIGYAFNMAVVSMPLVCACLSIYLLVFGLGIGSVPAVVNTEIYPLHARANCLSIALAAKWFFGFLTSRTYLSLSLALSTSKVSPRNHPDGIFWFYGLIAVAAFPILHRCMVETKGLTLEETSQLFRDPTNSDKPYAPWAFEGDPKKINSLKRGSSAERGRVLGRWQ